MNGKLFLNSLLGGMSAWRICETLARTGGFGVQVTRRRLLETFQHFLNVIEDLDAIKPGGKGFVSSVQVRLLHGMVRRRMLRLEQERPGYFNIKEWGVPINDLHQIGTINSYSTSLVFISLPRQGIHLEEQQIADCLALWRWVGHIMGTSVDWMSSPGRAKATMESIMVLELDPSRKSQIIANNILTSQVKVPPLYASRGYLAALCWQLNGKDLSQALAIDKPGITHRVLAWSQKWLLSLVSYRYSRLSEEERRKKDEVSPDPDSLSYIITIPIHTQKYLASADKWMQKFLSYGYNIIMSQRHGGLGQTTHFGFQYTPAFDKVTEMGTFAAERSWDLVLALGATVVFVVLIVFGYKAVFPWQQLGGWHAGSLEYLLTRRGS